MIQDDRRSLQQAIELSTCSDLILRSPSLKRVHARLRRAMARASRRMAASPNLLPWFETARIAAKCTQAAPAMACLLTMRLNVWDPAPDPQN